jgi:hypothetical protein
VRCCFACCCCAVLGSLSVLVCDAMVMMWVIGWLTFVHARRDVLTQSSDLWLLHLRDVVLGWCCGCLWVLLAGLVSLCRSSGVRLLQRWIVAWLLHLWRWWLDRWFARCYVTGNLCLSGGYNGVEIKLECVDEMLVYVVWWFLFCDVDFFVAGKCGICDGAEVQWLWYKVVDVMVVLE